MTHGADGMGLHAIGAHADLLAFLLLGLLGSVAHCVGMCSPFALIVSRRYGRPDGRHASLAAQLWYTGGRVATYAALGAIAGALGGLVQVAGALLGLQRTAAIVAGAVLVVWAGVSLMPFAPRSAASGAWFGRIARRLPAHPLAFGLLLGLLPCGLLYSALVASVARGGAIDGATALVAFGVGTAPALLGVSLADALLVRQRAFVNRLSQVFVLVMGVWYLWRGIAPLHLP